MKPASSLVALTFTLAASAAPAVAPEEAHALFGAADVVYDPTNHAQNILSAIRTLKSNINEALMIKHQLKSLANEFENLKKLDFSIVDEFANQMNDLFEVTGTINGLMQEFSSLQSEFDKLYPNFGDLIGIDAKELAKQATEWLEHSRDTILGASKTGAKVLENLPRSQAQLEGLLAQSQGAAGILQAAQAGNQLSAAIAGNLQTLNAQLATYSQAHMSFMMQQQAAQTAVAARNREIMKGWGERKTFSKAPVRP